jgi:hypothetical protein
MGISAEVAICLCQSSQLVGCSLFWKDVAIPLATAKWPRGWPLALCERAVGLAFPAAGGVFSTLIVLFYDMILMLRASIMGQTGGNGSIKSRLAVAVAYEGHKFINGEAVA